MSALTPRQVRNRFISDFGVLPYSLGVVRGSVGWVTAVVPSAGMCGYVLIPAEGHPWSNGASGEMVNELDVYGGITHHRHPWLGFDTIRAGAWWPPDDDPAGVGQRIGLLLDSPVRRRRQWTPWLMERETRRLALQVAKIGQTMRTANVRFAHLDVQVLNTPVQTPEGRARFSHLQYDPTHEMREGETS